MPIFPVLFVQGSAAVALQAGTAVFIEEEDLPIEAAVGEGAVYE